jgi:tRNA threonylcarbamoyladenosine biosynthesis protein TsaB
MPLTLAFDCAIAGLAVAVTGGAIPVLRRREGRDQPAELVPEIAAALQTAGVERRNIELIAVTLGPGSFTGVRVGLATARGLSLGLGVPLAGFATTDVLLAQAPPADGRLNVGVIDSRLGDWFAAFADEAPALMSAERLAERAGRRALSLVGPDAGNLAKTLRGLGADAVAYAQPLDVVVLAALAADRGVAHWRHCNTREGLPRPLYLRGVNVTSPDGSRRTVDT